MSYILRDSVSVVHPLRRCQEGCNSIAPFARASALFPSLHSLLATAFKDEAPPGCDKYAAALRVLCGEENDPSARHVLGCRLLTHRPGGLRALNSLATAERVAPVQCLYRTGIAYRYSVACARMRVGDIDASGRHPVRVVLGHNFLRPCADG